MENKAFKEVPVSLPEPTEASEAYLSRYTHITYSTASALIQDEKTGEVREATPEELERLRKLYEPHLKRSMREIFDGR